MPVCSRCLGIYSGFLLGTLLYQFIKKWSDFSIPGFWVFAVFIFPVVMDTGGNLFGLWHTGAWIRFLIGGFWGTILPFYFIPGISEAVRMAKKRN